MIKVILIVLGLGFVGLFLFGILVQWLTDKEIMKLEEQNKIGGV